MKPQLIKAGSREYDLWEHLVNSCEWGSFWATPSWTNVLCRAYGFEPHPILVKTKAGPVIVPAVSLSRRYRFWRSLESMPLGGYGGFLTEGRLSPEVIDEVLSTLGKLRITGLKIHLPPEADSKDFTNALLTSEPPTHILTLPADEDELFERTYAPSFRNKVRQAMKWGVRCRVLPMSEAISLVKRIYRAWIIMKKPGNVYPDELFKALADIPPNMIRCYIAWINDFPAAATIFFQQKVNGYSFLTVDDPKFREMRPVNYLYHTIFVELIKEGIHFFDLGKSLSIKSLEGFKEALGGIKKPLWSLALYGNLYHAVSTLFD